MQVDGVPAAAAAAGGGSVAGLSGSAEARGHVFSALAQLTQRLPDLFQVRLRVCCAVLGAAAWLSIYNIVILLACGV
jgi:hypothetical protein